MECGIAPTFSLPLQLKFSFTALFTAIRNVAMSLISRPLLMFPVDDTQSCQYTIVHSLSKSRPSTTVANPSLSSSSSFSSCFPVLSLLLPPLHCPPSTPLTSLLPDATPPVADPSTSPSFPLPALLDRLPNGPAAIAIHGPLVACEYVPSTPGLTGSLTNRGMNKSM